MVKKSFTPEHINATEKDLEGNQGIGRYIFLPGSDGRAHTISERFENVTTKTHPRGHTLYLGTLKVDGHKIDVASTSSGMGCPSMEIIAHELFHLGGKRFLRIGTAGTLQPKKVKIGHMVNAQASVRDESTTTNYVPVEVPAVASLEISASVLFAARKLNLLDHVHTGIVHCKSSLYAREFGEGPEGKANLAYIDLLSRAGVLASEMETATLFIQSQLYNHQLSQHGTGPKYRVLAGAILAMIASPDEPFEKSKRTVQVIEDSISLGIESFKTLAMQELFS